MQLEELVRRIRLGDKNAVKDLVSIYGNAVYLRAFERTQDKELAREAARQVFGQFVSTVQQRPDEDGWSFWFGDLIERNISAYAQIGNDMSYIEDELEQELYGEDAVRPAEPHAQQTANMPAAQQQPASRTFDPREDFAAEAEARAQQQGVKRDKAARSSCRSGRNDVFDEAFAPRKKKSPGHTLTVVLLIIVCIFLLWVVGGVAMTMKWIPYYDLGYSWFSTHIFKLF